MQIKRMITTVDVHAGTPMRVITGGVLDVPGVTMLEKMKWLQKHGDNLRLLMLREPRGYPAMCCNLILPPCHPDADAGFIIMEQSEYPPMSGGNTMAVVTVLLETGMLPMREPVTRLTLESPAGLIPVRADCAHGKVLRVTFQNVPAFATHLDVKLKLPLLGEVVVDIAWGGMFYVIADADQFELALIPQNGSRIAKTGEMLRAAAAEQLIVEHPDNPMFNGVTISQLYSQTANPEAHLKNAVTMSTGDFNWDAPETWTGAIDRCPCGTGTCAKMATLFARDELKLNQDFHYEGILGTVFTGRLVEETEVGPHRAVVPTVSGQAWITAISQHILDPGDPFPEGFTVSDIWP